MSASPTAILVINNYGPILYGQLGFSTENNLRLQCGWISVGVIFNLIGALMMDRFGRKPLMVTGVLGCCACLIVEAAVNAEFAEGPNAGENQVGLAFGVVAFYVLLAVYSLGVDVCGVVWYSEVFPEPYSSEGDLLFDCGHCVDGFGVSASDVDCAGNHWYVATVP